MVPSLPLLSCESSIVSVKENPDRKKLYQRKHPLNLTIKMKLFLTYYFRGQFFWQTVVKAEKPPLTAAITDFVSNAPVICEEVEQVVFDGGSILHIILWEKNIKLQDTGLKYTSYIISNFRSANVVFDDYPKNLIITDKTHKCRLICYFKEKGVHCYGTLSINTV